MFNLAVTHSVWSVKILEISQSWNKLSFYNLSHNDDVIAAVPLMQSMLKSN